MSVNAVLTLLALSQCLLLAAACGLFGGYKTIANRLMAFALLSESVRLLAVFLFIRANGDPASIVEYLMLTRVMLAPTLYLYTLSLTEGDFKIRPRHLWHAAPFAASCAIVFINHAADAFLSRGQMTLVQANITALTFILYGGMAIRRIEAYRATLMEYYSETQRHGLRWLKIAQAYLVLVGFGYVGAVGSFLAGADILTPGNALGISLLTTTLFIYIVSITGVIHFRGLSESGEKIAADEVPELERDAQGNAKYSSGLSEDEVAHYLQLLRQWMEKEKPYLEHGLKLADVSAALGLHPQQVSQVINQGAGKPFHDYINGYRIGRALDILRDNPDAVKRINDLYENCGFTSQSTFYKHFKKVTGKTPRQYLPQAA